MSVIRDESEKNRALPKKSIKQLKHRTNVVTMATGNLNKALEFNNKKCFFFNKHLYHVY